MKFPSDRFAAFLAHSLNSAQAKVCMVEPGQLYSTLLDALKAQYREPLLYHSSYRFRMSEDEAATRYFELTLERRLWLSNKVEMSVAHRLLEALCRRGIGAAWETAELRRLQDRPPQREPAAAPLIAPGTFEAVAGRLEKLPGEISSGNPATTIRERKGALWLLVGPLRTEVAEEISAWDAIICGPTRLQSLSLGGPFNRFCGVVIEVMRTANRPFQELLGMGRGICPFDWIGVLSTNQVRGIRRFLETVGLGGEPDTPDLWDRAWSKAPVPGFRSAAEFWTSEIGHTLRNRPQATAPAAWRRPVISGEALIVEPGSSPEILDEHQFRRQLVLLQEDGVISAAERALLERIYCGDTLADLAADAEVQAMLAERSLQLPLLVADLQHRIENWHIPEGADYG